MPKTVLIVEDNALNMEMFNDLLEAQGYNTLQTDDGQTAVTMARQHVPDLILMDIQLPSISGLEATELIKADDNLKHIPVIAVSASIVRGKESMVFQAGCDGYISKPISIPIFLETIAKFINN